MKLKKIILNLESEIDLKTWSSLNKSHNSYNDIKFYLLHDEENPKIKYVIYMFNEDSKIIKDKKDKAMKQSEFQQTVLTAIEKINNLDSKINSLEKNLKILKIMSLRNLTNKKNLMNQYYKKLKFLKNSIKMNYK